MKKRPVPLNKNKVNQTIILIRVWVYHGLKTNSKLPCSDWLWPSINSDKVCKAFVYTDLGFISRVRPDPDFEASERYNNQALTIIPGMCGATAYLTEELRVQQNRRVDADVLLCKTYDACGRDSFDFHDVRFTYSIRNWLLPSCMNNRAPGLITPRG